MEGLNTAKVPSAWVVLPYYAFAAISLLVICLLLPFYPEVFIGHYFQPKLLALTHIAVLGWISMIIFGASHQLLPVIFEVSLQSESLAKTTFFVFAAGIICLAYSFWNFYVGIHIQVASVLLLLSFLLFISNILSTARKSAAWNIHADFIVASSFWLLLTGIFGTMMAFNLSYPFLTKSHLLFLKIHAHMGIIGWFILLIIGVGSKLIPMFLLAHHLNVKKLSHAFYLINAGLIGFSVDSFLREEKAYLPLYTLLVITGVLFFVSYLIEAFRKGIRKQLDIGLKHTVASFLLLLLPIIIASVLSILPPEYNEQLLQVYLAYGTSIFLGFLSSLLLGQTFKTLPFIVWLKNQKESNQSQPGLLPKDLYWEKLANVQYVSYILSIPILITGILLAQIIIIRAGSCLLLLTAIAYNINVFKILIGARSSKARKP